MYRISYAKDKIVNRGTTISLYLIIYQNLVKTFSRYFHLSNNIIFRIIIYEVINNMTERNHITETEYVIMKYLWNLDHEATAREIREHFSQRNWSKQAVSTFLKRLVKAGYLKMRKVSPTKYYYTVLISEAEYNLLPVREVLHKSFDGSYGDLVCALINPNQKLSDEKIAKLNKLIDELYD